MSSIAIIDYGMGNLHSVAKALEHVADGHKITVTSDPAIVDAADRVLFPGVGAMRDCMAGLKELKLDAAIRRAIDSRPVFAICVGMQALMDMSEENDNTECLGVFPGKVRFFGTDMRDASGQRLKVPHMGWNQVRQRVDHPMWSGIEQDTRFYFVHSYYCEPQDESIIAGSCDYGKSFAASLYRDNLFAVQFHPEKSHNAGLQLLKNFTTWSP
ncbi:MAG: imidazole glycerol phosphate synthase subunit HisH [Gammaproteobacteria bacterium]|nr:imidazole glycerol phosphate synthase subunit HisH [Gammaproteobacteria bacterium]